MFRQISEIYEKEYEFELATANIKEAARLFELEKFAKVDASKALIKYAELMARDCSSASTSKIVESIQVSYWS